MRGACGEQLCVCLKHLCRKRIFVPESRGLSKKRVSRPQYIFMRKSVLAKGGILSSDARALSVHVCVCVCVGAYESAASLIVPPSSSWILFVDEVQMRTIGYESSAKGPHKFRSMTLVSSGDGLSRMHI